jgi:hypothetical protein
MRTLRLLAAVVAIGSLLAACDHARRDPNAPRTTNDPDSRRSMMR